MKLNAPGIRQQNFYLLTSANKTIIGTKKLEFFQEKLVSLELVDKTENELVYQYKLLNQSIQGSSLLHYWSADMDELQSGILLIADPNGELADIYNFKALSNKFSTETTPQVYAQYPADFCDTMIEATTALLANKDLYLQSLVGYSSWRFFFQNFYRPYSPSEQHSFTIKNHFGTVDLPLIIDQKNESSENGKSLQSISSKASLDAARFQRKDFARMLKDLTGVYNIDATLKVEMEENYTFSKNDSLATGEMFLETTVYDWYAVTTAHQLQQLSAEAVAAMNKEMEATNQAQYSAS